MADLIKILFIGDLIGKPGRLALEAQWSGLVQRYCPDIVIANGENSAGGFGITPAIAEWLFDLGLDAITTGNHVWDKKEIYDYLDQTERLIRPANYPCDTPGRGSCLIEKDGAIKVGVINVCGRVFMEPLDSPFTAVERELQRFEGQTKVVLVDMHAEATSEAITMGLFLNGKVSAVVGTHTHVQTSDEKILSRGTAYITDAGMTGPTDSVIGMKKEILYSRFLKQMPMRFEVASKGVELQGVFMTVSAKTGSALSIERIKIVL